jgi:hypothetical protein
MRKLKFDLNIDSNALLCPNPEEFYSKAYINQEIADNFRTLPGVKDSTKISTVEFPSVLKASACNFTDANQNLSAVTISVCAVSALAEICRFDLESTYVSQKMAKGSNGNWEVADFMSFYWDEMAKEVQAEISSIMWKGNTAGTGSTYTGANLFNTLCDGYEKILAADAGVVDVTLTAVTASNVIAAMTAVYAALPAALQSKTSDLRLYVASNVAVAYRIAVAQANTIGYTTLNPELTFLGIRIVEAPGMTSSKMVLTSKNNLIYAFDGEGDARAIKAINLEDTIAEPLLRSRVNLKIGFDIINPTEIVYFN